MEGVVLVEMSSGALQYTKSFSDAFDARHPKTERLNLSALIFALQNFAGSSIRQCKDTNQQSTSSSDVAEIAMLTTPLENMVLAATPSNKLLVVLFTIPDFAIEVAKSLVHRIAYNYENGGGAEMQLMTVLNQVPRRFRYAFSQAVDETIEQELISLSERLLLASFGESSKNLGPSDHYEPFLFFYYSACLDDSLSSVDFEKNANGNEKVAILDEEEYHKAASPVNPTLAEISRGNKQTVSIRNMMTSTRAIAATVSRKNGKKKKSRKTPRWKSRNAVMDHSEPQGFQRVIDISYHERKAAVMEPHRTDEVYGIAEVLLPFVELSALSMFAPASNIRASTEQQRTQQLDQIVWKNAPSATSGSEGDKPRAGNNIIAWRRGRCLLFYPITTVSSASQSRPRTRLAVAALFDSLELLLRAKADIQV